VKIGTGANVVTVDGIYFDGTITPVVPGMVIISQSGTDVGTSENGTIIGLGGNVGTTINYVVGIFVGILFGVTITAVWYNVYGIV